MPTFKELQTSKSKAVMAAFEQVAAQTLHDATTLDGFKQASKGFFKPLLGAEHNFAGGTVVAAHTAYLKFLTERAAASTVAGAKRGGPPAPAASSSSSKKAKAASAPASGAGAGAGSGGARFDEEDILLGVEHDEDIADGALLANQDALLDAELAMRQAWEHREVVKTAFTQAAAAKSLAASRFSTANDDYNDKFEAFKTLTDEAAGLKAQAAKREEKVSAAVQISKEASEAFVLVRAAVEQRNASRASAVAAAAAASAPPVFTDGQRAALRKTFSPAQLALISTSKAVSGEHLELNFTDEQYAEMVKLGVIPPNEVHAFVSKVPDEFR